MQHEEARMERVKLFKPVIKTPGTGSELYELHRFWRRRGTIGRAIRLARFGGG